MTRQTSAEPGSERRQATRFDVDKGRHLRASVPSPNGAYFSVLRFAISRFISALGRVSQP
jgi:hypothetical protein